MNQDDRDRDRNRDWRNDFDRERHQGGRGRMDLGSDWNDEDRFRRGYREGYGGYGSYGSGGSYGGGSYGGGGYGGGYGGSYGGNRFGGYDEDRRLQGARRDDRYELGGEQRYGGEYERGGDRQYDFGSTQRGGHYDRYQQQGGGGGWFGGERSGGQRGMMTSRGRGYDDYPFYGGGGSSGYEQQGGGYGRDRFEGRGWQEGDRDRGENRGMLGNLFNWFTGRDEQRGFMGKGPRGYKRSDDRIREDVCDALTRDPNVDASNIDVKVERGEVMLTGAVDDRRQKRFAEMCVEHVEGVNDVNNQIRVQRSDMQTSGQEQQSTAVGRGTSARSKQTGTQERNA